MIGKKISEIDNIKQYNVMYYKINTENPVITAIYKDRLVISDRDDVVYEPYIKKYLGIPQKEKVKCLYEKTCGAVMFTYKDGKRLYLLIKNDSGHIGFPKGHIELDETEYQTTLREVFEETGLKCNIIDGFRMEYSFDTLDETHKTCVYYMSEYEYQDAIIQQEEISKSWLVEYDEAMKLLNFWQDRDILKAAEGKLNSEKS